MVASPATTCGPVELAHIFAITNQNLGSQGPPVVGDYRGIPVLGVVAYGEEHQREEVRSTWFVRCGLDHGLNPHSPVTASPFQTAHFLRSLYVHRTTPIHFLIIGDTVGIQTLVEVSASGLYCIHDYPPPTSHLLRHSTP